MGRRLLPRQRCLRFCQHALQFNNACAAALREVGFATAASAKSLTRGMQQRVDLHRQVSRARKDQAGHRTRPCRQQYHDTIIGHETMRQQFHFIEITVVEDTPDQTPVEIGRASCRERV